MSNARKQCARMVNQRHHEILRKPCPANPSITHPVKVGIIGAGAAGLYAGLIVDSLVDSRITYDIFDAGLQ